MVTNSTGHFRCPSQWRDPDGIPIADWRRGQILEIRKKFEEVRVNFFGKESWLVNASRP
jgi:hypothetical protein